MILVLCGTQKQNFARMIREVEKLADDEEIIVQAGHSQYSSNKMKMFDFLSQEKLKILYEEADYIMTHAGAGSMFQAIEAGKKTLVFPRLQRYGEHVDDHQFQLAEKLQREGYLLIFHDGDDIRNAFNDLQGFKPKPYELRGNISLLIDEQLMLLFKRE